MDNQHVPKYIKVKNNIKKLFTEGDFSPGSKLPTENELAKKYNVSRHTIRKALNLLDQEGYLQKKQGVGTFFKESPKKETKNIGFISISLHDYIFSEILQGVDDILHEEGYQILLGNSKDSHQREAEILEGFLEKEVDGLIIEPAKSAYQYDNLELLKKFKDKGIPVICLDSKFSEERFNYISIDDCQGGVVATEHFIENGHKNIAIIYKALHQPALDRFKGYKQALKENNISYKENYIKKYYNSEFENTDGFKKEVRDLTKELMNLDNPPTGIFCFNDQVAILVKEILNDMGLLVPDDISLVGFDNSKLVSLNNISITSIDHPKENAGRKAASIFLNNISRIDSSFYENVVYEPKLVERNSVKNL